MITLIIPFVRNFVQVLRVLVLQLVHLQHGLDAGISSFCENSELNVATHNEVFDFFQGERVLLLGERFNTMEEVLRVVFEVDAEEELVLDELPPLLEASFEEPDPPIADLQALIRVQQVVLHLKFILTVEGSYH